MSSAEASATIHLGRSRVPWSRSRQVLSKIMRKLIRRLKRMVKCVQKGKPTEESRWACRCWRYLFSRPVARQLSSAVMSITSVFGMGTGGPSCQSTPTLLSTCLSRSAASRSLLCGDPYGIRTHVNGVRGRCLNHLTNGPSIASASLLSPGPPSGTRTRDPLIKSQLLYQLS